LFIGGPEVEFIKLFFHGGPEVEFTDKSWASRAPNRSPSPLLGPSQSPLGVSLADAHLSCPLRLLHRRVESRRGAPPRTPPPPRRPDRLVLRRLLAGAPRIVNSPPLLTSPSMAAATAAISRTSAAAAVAGSNSSEFRFFLSCDISLPLTFRVLQAPIPPPAQGNPFAPSSSPQILS
jgi:hypothetical protein